MKNIEGEAYHQTVGFFKAIIRYIVHMEAEVTSEWYF